MKIIYTLLVLMIVGTLVGGALILGTKPAEHVPGETAIVTTRDIVTTSRYKQYTPDTFTEAKNKKRVLFFYASWCPTCRPVDTELETKHDQIPENLVVFRINYNDTDTDEVEKNLATQYGITYQHTFVLVDDEGVAVTKWNGGGLSEILEHTK